MDTKEDLDQDQDAQEDTQSPGSNDRSGPENPSQNSRASSRYINKGTNEAEKYANDPKNASQGNSNQGQQGGLNKLKSRFSKGGGGPGGSNPAMDKLKSGLGMGKKQEGGSRAEQLRNKGRELAKEKSKQFAKQIAKQAAQKAVAAAASNPIVWIVVAIVVVILIIIIVVVGGGAGGALENTSKTPLTINKTGPTEAKAGDMLPYKITIGYPGSAQDVTVTDHIPDGTDYDPSTPPPAHYDAATRTVTWNAKEVVAPDAKGLISNVNTTFTLNLKATSDNAFLVNQAEGSVIGEATNNPPGGGGPVSGDIAKLLPNPIPPDPDGIQSEKDQALKAIAVNNSVYTAVSSATGIPWQVFAGIHYREGGAAQGTSLVSGRPIGGNEPDVVAGPGCSNDAPRGVDDGIPEPMAGGCGFSSMIDSGIYGGKLLKQKIDGNLGVYEDLVKALSRYNGGGNSNCGKGVPYNGCPRLFEGEDDPYALNFFDTKHKPMFVIYCADYTKCDPPREDGRPGTATVAKWAAQDIR